jgi:hypothetical protein
MKMSAPVPVIEATVVKSRIHVMSVLDMPEEVMDAIVVAVMAMPTHIAQTTSECSKAAAVLSIDLRLDVHNTQAPRNQVLGTLSNNDVVAMQYEPLSEHRGQ